ncbi:MAG: response regulator transcription factor [Gemmatimonadetes bacterium]|nr:response regulator transcription factor [Gemmatimonadota bacterium]
MPPSPVRPSEIQTHLRVVVADDERPARAFLTTMLRSQPDVEIVGEAESGTEAVEVIERTRPDLALLDLQMPELDGLGVVRMVRRDALPLIAFVTAYDEYAVQAFELSAIDYLLKPVDPVRLRLTINRALERLEQADFRPAEADRLKAVAEEVQVGASARYLRRIPVRKRDDIVILPVDQIAAVVADGELLHLTMTNNERFTITYRLKNLEARLDPAKFVRLSRGTLANVDLIQRISPMPGGTYVVSLRNNLQLPVSRLRARALRDELLRL